MLTAIIAAAALLAAPFGPVEELAIFNISFLDQPGPYTGRLDELQAEADELREWFVAQSYGQLDIVPTVYDITVNENVGDLGCKRPFRHRRAMQAALSPAALETNRFLFAVLPASKNFPRDKRCGWRGVAVVGCDTNCIAASNGRGFTRVANHELGHNLGFAHGDSALEGIKDKHPMSGGTGLMFAPYDAVQVGWIEPLDATDGAFAEVAALGEPGAASDFTRVLRVNREEGSYFISLRQPVGQDTNEREDPRIFDKLSVHLQRIRANGQLDRKGKLIALLAPGEWFTLADGTIFAAFLGPDGAFYAGVSQ